MIEKTFDAGNGIVFELRPVAWHDLRDIEKLIGKPVAPVYTYEGAGGAVAVKRHNETTLQTEQELLAWEKYQDDLAEFNHRHACFVIGLGVANPPEIPPEWIDERMRWGTTIPSDKYELIGFYILRAICKTPPAYNSLIDKIMEVSDLVLPQEVAAQEKSF